MSLSESVEREKTDLTTGSLAQEIARLKRLVQKRKAQGDIAPAKPIEDTLLVCERHGAWKPYVRDEQGVLRCAGAVCPVCRKEASLREMSRESETPSAFDGATLDSFTVKGFKQKAAVGMIREHGRRMCDRSDHRRGDGLVLWGAVGTGKTHLAIGLLRECQSKGLSGHFIRAVSLMDRLRQSRNFNARHEDLKLIDHLSEVDVLVIDDVGKSLGNDLERSGLFSLIDNRWVYSRPTVITTNVPPVELKDLLTPAGFDRLTSAGANILRMEWKSERIGTSKSTGKPSDQARAAEF